MLGRPPGSVIARGSSAPRVALAGVLVLSAVLFAIGVHAEKTTHHEGSTEVSQAPPHADTGETAREMSGETGALAPSAPEKTEHVLGVNTESNTVVAVAIIVSALLGAGVLLAPRFAELLWATAVFGLAAGVFDIAEIFHQISRSDFGLAALATSIAVLHFGVAALSAGIQRRRARTVSQPLRAG